MRVSKLLVLLAIILLASLALAGSAVCAQRCVLAELFTSTGWPTCPTAEAALDSVVKYDFKPEQLVVVRNHVGGYFYQSEASSRFYWYPETYAPGQGWAHWTPTLWLDGVEDVMELGSVQYTWNVYKNEIAARAEVPSPIVMDLQVEYGARADSGTVHLEVVATAPITFTDLRLGFAIVESNLNWGGYQWHQVLRDYFPTRFGISFAIAEGDTFTHSEDFVIQAAWKTQDCDIVACVQDSVTREVLQAVQSPVFIPAPEQVQNLTVTLDQDDLLLNWLPVEKDTNGNLLTVDHYQIYRDTVGFFGPGCDPFTTTANTYYLDDSGVVGDAGTHYYYSVTAVAGYKESRYSRVAGEFNRIVFTGK